jgi:hypothetical protein
VWPEEFRRYLILRIEKEGGPAAFCKKHDLQLSNVLQMVKSDKPIPESVAAVLGYERRTVYVRPLSFEQLMENFRGEAPKSPFPTD